MPVSKWVIGYPTVLKNQQRIRHLFNEITIMGNKEHSAFVSSKSRFQGFSGRNIHMIGRLVQHQEVRPFFKDFCQYEPGFLPAGKIADRFLHISPFKKPCCQFIPDIFLRHGWKKVMKMFQHFLVRCQCRRLLIKISRFYMKPQLAFSLDRCQKSRYCLEKSRLAGTVWPDNADLLSPSDAQ